MGTWKENVIMNLAKKMQGGKTAECAEMCCTQGNKCMWNQGKGASCANCASCPDSGGSPVLSITGASALAGLGE